MQLARQRNGKCLELLRVGRFHLDPNPALARIHPKSFLGEDGPGLATAKQRTDIMCLAWNIFLDEQLGVVEYFVAQKARVSQSTLVVRVHYLEIAARQRPRPCGI